MNPQEENEQLRSVALKNAQSIVQVRKQAQTELLQAKQTLEQRSNDLAHALSLLRATLESTADAVLVTNTAGLIIDDASPPQQSAGTPTSGARRGSPHESQ